MILQNLLQLTQAWQTPRIRLLALHLQGAAPYGPAPDTTAFCGSSSAACQQHDRACPDFRFGLLGYVAIFSLVLSQRRMAFLNSWEC